MSVKYRSALLLGALVLLVFSHGARADEVRVAGLSDLRLLADDARADSRPVVLMFSAAHCGYCRQVEDEFLEPMIRSGDYDDRVLFRKVNLDAGLRQLTDFDGGTLSVDDFASRYGISVTPTVVFLDHRGHQLAKKLVGITTPDFYGGYLDRRIDTAVERLRNPRTVAEIRAARQ